MSPLNSVRLTIYTKFFTGSYNLKRYGISESFAFDKFSWWNSNNMINVNYIASETIDLLAAGVDGLTSYFTSNNDLSHRIPLNVLGKLLDRYSFKFIKPVS